MFMKILLTAILAIDTAAVLNVAISVFRSSSRPRAAWHEMLTFVNVVLAVFVTVVSALGLAFYKIWS